MHRLNIWGSWAPEHRLGSSSAAHGIFPDLRQNQFLLHWQADSLPPSHQGSPNSYLFRSCLPEKTMIAKDEHLSPLPALGRVLLKYKNKQTNKKPSTFHLLFKKMKLDLKNASLLHLSF